MSSFRPALTLRATRDRKAAIAFFRKTLGAAHTTPPRVVTVDKNPAYPVAFEAVRHEGLVRPRSNLRQCKYLNNIIEQDHRFIKRRTRPMLGFKRFTTAWRTLRGIEIMHALRIGTGAMDGEGRRGRADAADPQGVRIGRVTRSTQRILAIDRHRDVHVLVGIDPDNHRLRFVQVRHAVRHCRLLGLRRWLVRAGGQDCDGPFVRQALSGHGPSGQRATE